MTGLWRFQSIKYGAASATHSSTATSPAAIVSISLKNRKTGPIDL